ncbi:DUF1604-domain-containing protein [Teratosphaeria nubilosa]|uniref:DUF1604-domain-containing protein n=1 Tax=Teratosphaeria nubilosa TaxID=161662 RepID=A0A6G1LE29_9PEZI|nr:DUF1604-domain-containing protein [Teratosphaeria nubilosa]
MSHSKRSRAAFESDHSNAPPHHAPHALYGTPLPAYDPDVRDDGSYKPVWQQEVTDERGRKRLHGAFTGGFSAGYFNTVGSKEGWTPSTFVSSRSNRAKDQKPAQKVEDFMDEEDLAEQAETEKIETQGGFAGLGVATGTAYGGGMFADLFKTTGETMGVKLLQKMGWRHGQGIGAKVKRRAEGDKTGELHAFAPQNSRMISFNRKTDRKGLGFAGESSLEVDGKPEADEDDASERDARILQTNRSKLLSKPKKQKKTGFGVGVLNDNGSDDEDPYAMGPQISYNRVIGKDRKKKGGLTASNANPATPKPVFISKKLTQRTSTSAGFRKCRDGRLPLDGFVLSLAPLTIYEESRYPPPEIPDGWVPSKSGLKSSGGKSDFQSTADAAKASTLDPKSRAALLGEQQLPGKSVFDFLSSAARDRLASASGNMNLPQARGEGAPAGYEATEAEKSRTLWDLVPQLDKEIAAAALHRGNTGWMPYAEDEGKRARYRYFLELRTGAQSNLPDRPKTFSVDEWAKELREFAQAAEVFKPISGLMASRFTSSSAAPKLASDAPDSSGRSSADKVEDPAEKAAKMGMFGPLTRIRQSFFPTRLLCKRFGVKPPANVSVADDEGVVDASKRLDVVSQASLDQMMREADWSQASGGKGFVSRGVEEGGEEARRKVQEVDVERNEAIEGQKAGEAVFRAVFGSGDEEE